MTAAYDNKKPISNRLFGLMQSKINADAAIELITNPLRRMASPMMTNEIISEARKMEGESPAMRA